MRKGLICCTHNTKTRVIANKETVQFKMVSMCSEKPICAPPRLSEFPNVVLETVPMFVSLTMTLSRRFNGRSSSASSFHAIQAIDGERSLALYPQVVSQASQYFRSSEKKATCEGCFARQSVCSLHSGMSWAVHPQEFSKVDVDHRHIPVWGSHSTFHFNRPVYLFD